MCCMGVACPRATFPEHSLLDQGVVMCVCACWCVDQSVKNSQETVPLGNRSADRQCLLRTFLERACANDMAQVSQVPQ